MPNLSITKKKKFWLDISSSTEALETLVKDEISLHLLVKFAKGACTNEIDLCIAGIHCMSSVDIDLP